MIPHPFFRLVTTALLTIAVYCLSAAARQIEIWPYERLFEKADTVVIAQPKRSVDNDDRLESSWEEAFVGIDTTFEVEHALKGTPGKKLTLLHFRSEAPLQNGPLFVSFSTNESARQTESGKELAPRIRAFREGPASYLLFLKRRDDGRYEAVSGQIDPALSVRTISEPRQGF